MTKDDGASTNNSTKLTSGDTKPWLLGLLALLLVAIVAVLVFHNNSSTASKQGPSVVANHKTATTPSLSLTPANMKLTSGGNLTVEIWADSGTTRVNAVQANLNYPADKLNFVGIDATTSAFSVSAENKGGGGTVNIARGSTTPLTGKILVAKVNFTVGTGKTGKAAVTFGAGTALVGYANSTNVLAASNGGTYSF